MFLTIMQEPVVWLPWIPFQVFWALLSAGALHHGLMASGSVCLCAEVCVYLCTQHIDAVLSRITKDILSLCHATQSLFFLISLHPHHYTSPLLSPLPHR